MLNVISGLLSGAGAPASTTSYESISTVTVGAGGSSSITFSSIPSTFKHLQIRGIARSTRAATNDYVRMQFNSDTTSTNYRDHLLYGTGSAAAAGDDGNNAGIFLHRISGSTATSGVFGTLVIDILDYTSTAKLKTTRQLGGFDNNGSGEIDFGSGLWLKTPEAITTIKLEAQAGTSNFAQYSSFALYGIKG